MTAREFKGKSLTQLPDSYTIIDIITTGHDFDYDALLEIGAMKIVNNQPTDSYSSLVHYQGIDEFIQEITGLTDDLLQDAPESKTVLSEFLNFIGDDILVGHAINFDINFLYGKCEHFLGKPLKNDYVDTVRIARKLIDLPHHRMNDLIEYFQLEPRTHSRAGTGCTTVFEIFNHLKQAASQLDDYDAVWKRTAHSVGVKAKDVSPETLEFDEDNPLYDKVCVFTGALEKMTRKEAMQIVSNLGGINGDSVTKKTNYLILGNNDYCSTITDGKSSKQKKAEKLILSGQDLTILSENVFYEMIDNYVK